MNLINKYDYERINSINKHLKNPDFWIKVPQSVIIDFSINKSVSKEDKNIIHDALLIIVYLSINYNRIGIVTFTLEDIIEFAGYENSNRDKIKDFRSALDYVVKKYSIIKASSKEITQCSLRTSIRLYICADTFKLENEKFFAKLQLSDICKIVNSKDIITKFRIENKDEDEFEKLLPNCNVSVSKILYLICFYRLNMSRRRGDIHDTSHIEMQPEFYATNINDLSSAIKISTDTIYNALKTLRLLKILEFNRKREKNFYTGKWEMSPMYIVPYDNTILKLPNSKEVIKHEYELEQAEKWYKKAINESTLSNRKKWNTILKLMVPGGRKIDIEKIEANSERFKDIT